MGQIVVEVPNIGDFKEVAVIEILVAPGSEVEAEAPLISLESDKASMDVASPASGTVSEVLVKVGDKVSHGDPILLLADGDDDRGAVAETAADAAPTAAAEAAVSAPRDPVPAKGRDRAGVVVLGAGPGGYTAAFRAADLGLDVVLVERYPRLGGVCLNVGCIPSKALLHLAEVKKDALAASAHGIHFKEPQIDLKKLAEFKTGVINKLTDGLAGLAKRRKVRVIQGRGYFVSPHRLAIAGEDGSAREIDFDNAIIAVGSRSIELPMFAKSDPAVLDSTGALELKRVPRRLLIVGGGIIGLEMACVYEALGSEITVVEMTEGLMPGCDPDLVKPLMKTLKGRLAAIHTSTRVTGAKIRKGKTRQIEVAFDGAEAPKGGLFDAVLVAAGRAPNGMQICAEAAGVAVDEKGFIGSDIQMRTAVPHIFAIGDVRGQPMLAHKATHEAKVAAEVIAGYKAAFDVRGIPSVAYTSPEVAWVGRTEPGEGVKVAKFPWAASGRALSMDSAEGLTKLFYEEASGRVLGVGMVGTNAGELIAEAALAIEMSCDIEDLSRTIHPHPTLSETLNFAAEVAAGVVTDIYLPQPKRRNRA